MSGWWKMGRTEAPRRACGPGLAGAVVIALAVAAPLAAGEQTTVQPLQGQAPEQVQQDMAGCQNSATQATGYTPSQQPVAAAPSRPSGKRLKGAAAVRWPAASGRRRAATIWRHGTRSTTIASRTIARTRRRHLPGPVRWSAAWRPARIAARDGASKASSNNRRAPGASPTRVACRAGGYP